MAHSTFVKSIAVQGAKEFQDLYRRSAIPHMWKILLPTRTKPRIEARNDAVFETSY